MKKILLLGFLLLLASCTSPIEEDVREEPPVSEVTPPLEEETEEPVIEEPVVEDPVEEPEPPIDEVPEPEEEEEPEPPIVETEEEEPEEPVVTIPLSDLARLRNLDFCKIEQTVFYPGEPPQSKGFPLNYSVVPPKGVINVAFVAVDFPDVKGDPKFIEQWLNEIYLMEEWSHFVAGDKMEYRVHFEPKWITAPKEAKWYGCEACVRVMMGDNNEGMVNRLQPEMEAINQVLTAADDYYDWANIDFAMFMFPTYAEAAPHYVRLYSHGGNNFTPKAGQVHVPVFGGFLGWLDPEYTDYTMWDFAVHEVLHEQGLIGHGPYNGGYYAVMQDQHGYSKMLLSWEAFLLDWWDEKHLACIDLEDLDEAFTFQLDSLDLNGIINEGHKNLMIRLNQEEIVVIEYRTDGPFSDLPKEVHGMTAYHINVNQPQFRCDACENLTIEQYEAMNFWRYIRDSQKMHPCTRPVMHPVYGNKVGQFCNQSAFVHKKGTELIFQNLRITIIEDNIIEVQRIKED